MRHQRILQSVVLLCVGLVLGTYPASALDLDLLLPVGPADQTQYDMAMTNGAAHVVYRQGGNVYYATVNKNNLNWAVRNLGPGNWPTIASDINGNVMVAYENGGTIYETGPHTSWNPSVIATGIAGGKPTLSSPFFVTGWQMVVEGNIDGDSYREVVRLVKSGTGWGSPQLLLDGWYDSGSGNYYGQPSIAAFADGTYALGYEQDNWGGRTSWSSKWAGVSGLGSSIGVGTDWNASIQISRRGVSSISEDASTKAAVFACAVNNSIYAAINEGSGWSWLINGYSGGSAPAVSWTGGVFRSSSGALRFVTSDDQGAVVIEPLVYQGSELSGNDPLIWAMDDQFFLYRDSNGVLQFGARFAGVAVPEPSAMMLAGLAGPLVAMVLRRKSR